MKVKLNLSLDENVKEEIIKRAKEKGLKPSAYISYLVMSCEGVGK